MSVRQVHVPYGHVRVAAKDEFQGPYYGMVRLPPAATIELPPTSNGVARVAQQETPAGCEIWRMTKDSRELMDAPPGGAVYGETYAECLAALVRLHPAPEGFARVARLTGVYTNREGQGYHDTFRVEDDGRDNDLPPIEAVVHAPAYVVPEDAERIYTTSYYSPNDACSSTRRDEILGDIRRAAERHDGPMPLIPFKPARQVAEYLRSHKGPGKPGECLAVTIGGADACTYMDWRNGKLWAHAVRYDAQMAKKREKRDAYAEKKAKAKNAADKRLRDIGVELNHLRRTVKRSLTERTMGGVPGAFEGHFGAACADDVTSRISRTYHGDRLAEALMLHRQLFGDNDHLDWEAYTRVRGLIEAAELTQVERDAVGVSADLWHELSAFKGRPRRVPRGARMTSCIGCGREQREDPRRMTRHKPLIAGPRVKFHCRFCAYDLRRTIEPEDTRVEEVESPPAEEVEDTVTTDQAASSAVASSPA